MERRQFHGKSPPGGELCMQKTAFFSFQGTIFASAMNFKCVDVEALQKGSTIVCSTQEICG